jgi:cell division protein FtsA
MSKQRIITGIDLGSSKISTLVAQLSVDQVSFEQSIHIIGVSTVESRGVRKGQIVDIEEAVEAIIESVEGAERMAGFNIDAAFVSLGGAQVSSQNSHGVVAVTDPQGEIGDADVARVVEAASAISLPSSRELIHVIPREYIVDGDAGVKDPVGMSGIRLEVDTHLVTASSSGVKNMRKAINEVGINVSKLVYSGLSSGDAVLTKTEKELGCILVDIGGGTTSVAVYVEGALSYSCVIPVGAKNVTNDLAIGLRVSLEAAEKIKVSLSDHEKKLKKAKEAKETGPDEIDLSFIDSSETKKVSRKTLVEGIIRPRLNEIFGMIKVQLDKEGLSARVPSGVVLTGGGAETVGVVESAKRVLSLPVRVGVPSGVSGLIDDILHPSYATAVGLILFGAHAEPDESMSSISKRLKMQTKGSGQSGNIGNVANNVIQKVIQSVKDLLP